jgi:RNA-dependent RNA polymerase
MASRQHPFFAEVEEKYLEEFVPGRLDYCAELTKIIKTLYGTTNQYLKFDSHLHILLPQLPIHIIRCSSKYSQKVAKQHAYWSGIQYLSSVFRNWNNKIAEIDPNSTIVSCRECSHELGLVDDFCFFIISDNEIAFALHPSRNLAYESKNKFIIGERGKSQNLMYALHCPSCEGKLGFDTSLGPQKSRIFQFGAEKICFNGWRSYHSKWRFLDRLPEFGRIQRYSLEKESMIDRMEKPAIPLVFPSHEEDFQWRDLITSTVHPRAEQLKAFALTLRCNSIIVLPTGAGKTLIASLTIARFAQLNPELMTAMIVDRIPLVHQQAHSICRDVSLRVFPLCSETTSFIVKQKILKGSFQCLVATAGSFVELLNDPGCSIQQFSVLVFDECHHATKRHKYCEILERVEASGRSPRLLGLSASPVAGKDSAEIQSAMERIKAVFLNATIYRPVSTRSEPNYSWHTVSFSTQQQKTNDQLQSDLLQLCLKLQSASNDQKEARWFREMPYSTIMAWAQSLIPFPSNRALVTLGKISSAFERNKLLGPAYIDRSDDDFHSFDPTQLSPFLLKMEDIIRDLPSTSRIIVFVERKESAQELKCRLQYSFPELNPSYVVGNTGWNGMNLKAQSEILKNFNRPESEATRLDQVRLIVSTSVLEEGLDIQSCDAVFRFGGRSSFIQFVQSRGRARSGKMYVILTTEDRAFIDKIFREEQLLHHALQLESCRAIGLIEDTVSSFQLDPSSSGTLEEAMDFERRSDGQPIALKFFVNCPRDRAVTIAVKNELTSLGLITEISHLNFSYGTACVESGNNLLFDMTDSVITVNVESPYSITDFMKSLTSMWTFSIRLAYTFFDVYMPLPASLLIESPVSESIHKVDGVVRVEVGLFLDRRSYEVTERLGSKSELEYASLSISDDNVMKLKANFIGHAETTLTIQSPVASFAQFVLISADQSIFTVFFCVNCTPALLLTDDAKTVRISTPHHCAIPSSPNSFIHLAQLELQKFAETPLFVITFPLQKLAHVLDMLTSRELGFEIYFTHLTPEGSDAIESLQRKKALNSITEKFWNLVSFKELTQLEQKIILSLSSLASLLHGLVMDSISYHRIQMDIYQTLLAGVEEPHVGSASRHQFVLQKLVEILEMLPIYFQNQTIWTDCYELYSLAKKERLTESLEPSFDTAIDLEGYKAVLSVLITPSRVIFRPHYFVKTNRLLRDYQTEEFAYVSFVDEDSAPLFNLDIFHSRFILFLVHGIRIGFTSFSFLLCSASQQKEQRAIFLSGGPETAQSIRDSIALFEDFGGDLAAYMSRLGLFCTADTELMTVDSSMVQVEADLYTHNNDPRRGKNLVDGAGRISRRMFDPAIASLPSSVGQICAFQFRFGGSKGVFVVCDEEHMRCDLLLRESNVKFQSTHRALCLVQPASYFPLALNREMLNLLFSFIHHGESSERWDPFPVVRKLQKIELASAAEMFIRRESALRELKKRIQREGLDLEALCTHSFDLYGDCFVKQMLSVIYHSRCRMLRTKTHIPLEQGAYLMGIPDPTGTLRDGEVFYQLVDPSRDHMVGSGRQLIYRNPCLDPGDLRIVTAVDIPALRRYSNVLIFPAASTCLRSLSAECSGGDLDGDMFSIIFDESLIPPMEFPPADYDQIANMAKLEIAPPNEDSAVSLNVRISESIVRAMTNSNLGKIARMHLALCDSLPSQAADPLARELARTQSVAVDFIKTGVPPEVPSEAKTLLEANGYPSFMENKKKPYYVSQRPLGLLYDDVISTVCELTQGQNLFGSAMTDTSSGPIQPNPLFDHPGKEKYVPHAEQIYREYSSLLNGLFSRFSLSCDAELVLSLTLDSSPELIRDQRERERSLSEIWSFIKRKYRGIFLRVTEDNERLVQASAWHFVAYSTPPFHLSFSWIISDHLLLLARTKTSLSACELKNPFRVIGNSVLDSWSKMKGDLNDLVTAKLAIFHRILEEVNSHNLYDVVLFGSVESLLCDENSDLDIFVSRKDSMESMTKTLQLSLLRDFGPTLDHFASSWNVREDPFIPIIKASIENSFGVSQNVDFTGCVDGVYKANYLRSFYSQSACNLVLMNCLMEWARCCGLIAVSNEECDDKTVATNFLRKGEFHAFVLSILDQPMMTTTPSISNPSINQLILRDDFDSEQIGERLIYFFQTGQALSNEIDFLYMWPIPGSPIHIINSELMKRVTISCSRAYHCLSRSLSWSFLQQNAIAKDHKEMTTIHIPLISKTAKFLLKSSRWHSMILENASKAKIRISSNSLHCEVQATGTRVQIMKFRSSFRQFYSKGRRDQSKVNFNSTAYFVANGTIFYCRDAYSVMSKLSFETYLGPKQRHHSFKLSRPILSHCHGSQRPVAWKEKCKEFFIERLLQQLEGYTPQEDEIITLSFHFGMFYAIRAEDCFRTDVVTLNDMSHALARGRGRRKEWEYLDHLQTSSVIPNDPPDPLSSHEPNPRERLSRPPRLSSSFWNGISNWRNKTSSPDQLISALTNIFLGLGYVRHFENDHTRWKAAYRLNSSYLVEVKYLDDIKTPTLVAEKPLNWLTATLLSGESFPQSMSQSGDRNISPPHYLADHDLRLKLSTIRKLSPDESLYQSVFPPPLLGGEGSSKALFSLDSKGNPIPRDKNVTLVQRMKTRLLFDSTLTSPAVDRDGRHPSRPWIRAALSKTGYFAGNDLKEFNEGFNLSIDAHPLPLWRWINGELTEMEMVVWLGSVFDHVLLVSDALRNSSTTSLGRG